MIPSIGGKLSGLSSIKTTLTAGAGYNYITYGGLYSSPGMVVRLTDTTFALTYIDKNTNYLNCVVGTVSNGNVITYGTPRASQRSQCVSMTDIVLVSPTKIAVSWCRNLNKTAELEIFTISGTTVTSSANITIGNAQSIDDQSWAKITLLDSSRIAYVYYYTALGASELRMSIVNILNYNIGTDYFLEQNPNASSYYDIVGLTSNKFILKNFGNHRVVNTSGESIISVGTQYYLTESQAHLTKLDSTTYMSTNHPSVVEFITVSGDVITKQQTNSITFGNGVADATVQFGDVVKLTEDDMVMVVSDAGDETGACILHKNGYVLTRENWMIPYTTASQTFNSITALNETTVVIARANYNTNDFGGEAMVLVAS